MSYSRFGQDSDMYLYFSVGGYVCCCWCALDPDSDSQQLYDGQAVYDHIREHIAAGHQINERCQTFTVEQWQREFDDEVPA